MPGKPNVAVWDTAFGGTMEPKAYLYAIPREYYEKYHVRRYGSTEQATALYPNVLLSSLVLTKTTPKLSSATLETVLP